MLKKILIIPCLLFFSLGLWQSFRWHWKVNIIQNMNLPSVCPLPSDNLEKFNYKRVKIDGILSNIELYVFAGQRGYHVLSPMLLATGSYMLVNKGIIDHKKEREPKIEKVVIEGILYCDNKKNWFVGNDAVSNTWFTFNAEEISKELGIGLEKCILWQNDFDNRLTIQPMRHLEYAITWFLLSVIWLVMFIVFYRRNSNSSV
ncbi:MAG: SURF1 family protein [Wolbachia endosymbiont of Tyrophagus putrescentiae]|nr:SURF1 family protein [Wolbachia endosymbiont of Tyrophagus putrescentiae]